MGRGLHVLIVSAFAGLVCAAPVEFFVAPTGSDADSGTKEKPFASIERARDALRAFRKTRSLPDGGAVVWIAAGTYALTTSIELRAEDSGSATTPIIYRAVDGAEVRVTGGKTLGGFQPIEDKEVLPRFDAQVRDKILQCDLRAHGIADFGALRSRGFGRDVAPAHMELFFGGKRMTLARWPNEGYVAIAGVGAADPGGDGHGATLGKLDAGFRYEGDRPARWKSARDAWVHGFWAWDWANSYEAVAGIDLEKRLVTTKPPHGLYGFRAGQRMYFLNVLEELDAPGEFYVDRERGILYFYPPSPIDAGAPTVSLLEKSMFVMRDVRHVTIRGLIFECSRGEGIRMTGGEGNCVGGCTFRNLGNFAVVVEGGKGHNIVGCDMYQLGDGGVNMSGGDRSTLTRGEHYAVNNHAYTLAEWSRCYQPAFLLHGVGLRVAHNLIHDHPHCPILFSGNEHVIEFNDIHHVCLDTGDVGVIYTGRDWTYRGTVIRHNFIHETGGVGMGSMGVYLDDCVSGETIVGNVFYKVQRAAFIGGGRDHTVENNIFVECTPAVAIDGRGLDKNPVWHQMVYKTMRDRLDEVRRWGTLYDARYPALKNVDAYYAKDGGVPPEGNLVARNICVGGRWLEISWHAKPEMVTVRDNFVGADPGFVDAATKNFQLRDDAAVYAQGFTRIPFEKIGLVRDEYRPGATRP